VILLAGSTGEFTKIFHQHIRCAPFLHARYGTWLALLCKSESAEPSGVCFKDSNLLQRVKVGILRMACKDFLAQVA